MIPLTGPAIITSSLLIILRDDSDLTSVSSTLLEYTLATFGNRLRIERGGGGGGGGSG